MRFQTLKGLFRFLRPYGWLLCVIFILFMVVFQHGTYNLSTMVLAVISVALTATGGYAFNDYFDCESDAIEHPERPLPSRQITPAQSLTFGVLMFLAAAAVSLLLNPLAFAIVVLVSVFLIMYPSIFKKRSGFLSNIAVGFVEGISIPVFAEAVLFQQVSIMSLSFIGFAFVGVGGNILTDIVGVDGDRKMGLSTLAVTHGTRTASQVGALVLFCASIVSTLPYFIGVVSVLYLVPIVLWVCILFYLAVPFFKEQNMPHMEKQIRMIKASFVLFLIALILGTFA